MSILTARGQLASGRGITRGAEDSVTLSDEHKIRDFVLNMGIRVSSIVIPTLNHISFYDELSSSSGGQSYLIKKSPYPMDIYVSIIKSFTNILNVHIKKEKV